MTATSTDAAASFLHDFALQIAREVVAEIRNADNEDRPNRLLRIPEVAARLGKSDRAVRKMVNREGGREPVLASVKDGGTRCVEERVLEEYIAGLRET